MNKWGYKRSNGERKEEAKSKKLTTKHKVGREQWRNEIYYFLLEIKPEFALKCRGQMTGCAEVRNNYVLLWCYFGVDV
jgi:hypothetical protein